MALALLYTTAMFATIALRHGGFGQRHANTTYNPTTSRYLGKVALGMWVHVLFKYCNQEDGSGESRYMTCWTTTRSVLTRPKLKYLYLYILTMYPYIDICSKKDVCTVDWCYFCCSTKKEIMNSNHLML